MLIVMFIMLIALGALIPAVLVVEVKWTPGHHQQLDWRN